MSDEPTLDHVSAGRAPIVDVVFIHGLTGDPRKTWTDESGQEFSPCWLDEELERISVYTLGYPAGVFKKWAKKEMDMFERAGNVLERLAGNGIGERPIAFVAHSLGGILTKMILRKSSEADDTDWRRVSEATKLVVYLSTPHTGSAMAGVLNTLPLASKPVEILANETGFLDDLNNHYRTFANGRKDLDTVVYYETHATKSVVVVPRTSADPGVGRTPVPVDKDHVNVCKPYDRSDVVYLGVTRHIRNVLKSVVQSNTESADIVQRDDYESGNPQDRRDLLQKLIDAGREHEYDYANEVQNSFARGYTKIGLLTAAREDHDNLLSEVETRFVTHVYHPLICQLASDEDIRKALQDDVIDPLASKSIGGTRFRSKAILSALYYLTEQCYVRWDPPK